MTGAHLQVEVLAGADEGLRLRFPVPGSYVLGTAGTPDVGLQQLTDPSLADSHLLVSAGKGGTLKVACLGPAGSATLSGHAFEEAEVSSGGILQIGETSIRLTLVREDAVVGGVPRARLSHFHVLEEIGQGAFSRVYDAVERATGRRVALKRLRLSPGPTKDKLISAFLREIQTTSALDHPGIAKVLSAGRRGDDLFLAMEYVDGPDLDACVRIQGPLPSDTVRHIARGMLEALAHAHERGVIHRDLKPSNVMLRGECDGAEVVLVDFGLAVEVRSGSEWGLTITGDFRGTPAFTAPECLANARRHSVRADLFGVGATLYFALTGRDCREKPGEHESSLEALSTAEVIPLLTTCADAAPDLQTAIDGALTLDPEARWPSAAAMLAALAPATSPVSDLG